MIRKFLPLGLLLLLSYQIPACGVSWEDVYKRLECVKKRLNALTPAQAVLVGSALSGTAFLAYRYLTQTDMVDVSVQTDDIPRASAEAGGEDFSSQCMRPASPVEFLACRSNSPEAAISDLAGIEAALPVQEQNDRLVPLAAAAVADPDSDWKDEVVSAHSRPEMLSLLQEAMREPFLPVACSGDEMFQGASIAAQAAPGRFELDDVSQASSSERSAIGLDRSGDRFTQYAHLQGLDISHDKAIKDGAYLMSRLKRGEAVDFATQREYLNAIINLIWYVYAQAVSRGEAHDEGTFVFHGDLAQQVFAFLKRYVDHFALPITAGEASWRFLVPSMSSSISGMSWGEFANYNLWYSAQTSWLAFNGKSVADWLTFNMFVQKGRDSSHFTHTKSFVDEAMMHYGIDIVYNDNESPSFAKLPTQKSHILFGQSCDLNGDLVTFVKIENHGIYRALSTVAHLKEFAVSQGGKQVCSNYYEAPSQWRKERAPDSLIKLFKLIAPALSAKEQADLKAYGLQFTVCKALEIADNPLAKPYLDLVRALFNHEATRFGAEVSINAEDLMDEGYYGISGLTADQYQRIASVVEFTREIERLKAVYDLRLAMSVFEQSDDKSVQKAYSSVMGIYTPWLVAQGILRPSQVSLDPSASQDPRQEIALLRASIDGHFKVLASAGNSELANFQIDINRFLDNLYSRLQ